MPGAPNDQGHQSGPGGRQQAKSSLAPRAASRRRDEISTVGSCASALVSSSDAKAVSLASSEGAQARQPSPGRFHRVGIAAVTYVA
jgi:hypothetical protein